MLGTETYIEVGGEGAEDDGRLRLVREEEHFGLAHVVRLEYVVVLARDLDRPVADVLERHLLQRVRVELCIARLVVLHRHGEGRVDAVGRVLLDALLVADRSELFAVDGADPQHLLVLNAELLKLAPVPLRFLIYGR